MKRGLVRDVTWRDQNGVVHIAYWGPERHSHGHWGYHKVCTGAPLLQVDERSAYVDDGHPTCFACMAKT